MVPRDEPEKTDRLGKQGTPVEDRSEHLSAIEQKAGGKTLGNEANTEEQDSTNPAKSIGKRWWDSLNSNQSVNVLLMMFTGCLVVVGVQQCSEVGEANRVAGRAATAAERAATAAEGAVSVADRSLRVTQKAIIVARTPQAVNVQAKPFEVQVALQNTGLTSAKEVKEWLGIHLLTEGETWPDFEKEEVAISGNPNHYTIFPHEGSGVSYNSVDGLSDEEKAKATGHAFEYLVFGRVTYQDEFDSNHFLKYCTIYYYDDKNTQVRAAPCATWNEVG